MTNQKHLVNESDDLVKDLVKDAISRQAVIERLKKEDKILYTPTGLNYLIRAIQELPSVKPQESKTGHWIVHPKGIYAHLVCDKCLTCAPYDCKTNYCHNCGCRMVKTQESEENK